MITLDGLRKSYGTRTVLDGVSLALEPARVRIISQPVESSVDAGQRGVRQREGRVQAYCLLVQAEGAVQVAALAARPALVVLTLQVEAKSLGVLGRRCGECSRNALETHLLTQANFMPDLVPAMYRLKVTTLRTNMELGLAF